MVETRSGGKSSADNTASKRAAPKSKSQTKPASKPGKAAPSKKRQHADDAATDVKEPPAKKGTPAPTAPEATTDEKKPSSKATSPALKKLLDQYGDLPLSGIQGIDITSSSPTPETLLTLLLNAMFSSARISHELAEKTLRCVVQEGWGDVKKLKESTWERR